MVRKTWRRRVIEALGEDDWTYQKKGNETLQVWYVFRTKRVIKGWWFLPDREKEDANMKVVAEGTKECFKVWDGRVVDEIAKKLKGTDTKIVLD